MNRDKMVVLTFISKHEDDSDVDFEFGPCTEQEGEALVELLNTKYKGNEVTLIQKLSGIMTPDARSWVNGRFCAEVVPAFSYDLGITQVTELLDF